MHENMFLIWILPVCSVFCLFLSMSKNTIIVKIFPTAKWLKVKFAGDKEENKYGSDFKGVSTSGG